METQIVRTEIESIETIKDADLIVLYKLKNGNNVVWGKDVFEVGEKVLYIKEQSLLPKPLIEMLGLVGRLAGKTKNRVKAIRLKGTYSEGLILKDVINCEDSELDKLLGVTKYIPTTPQCMSGKVFYVDPKHIYSFEVEKPDISELDLDEEVLGVTEKIHGTNVRIGKVDFSDERLFGKNKNIYICSKGLGNKGFVFENTVDNVYTKVFNEYADIIDSTLAPGDHIVGEIFGSGVQDLKYGRQDPSMAVISARFENSGYLSDVIGSVPLVQGINTLRDFYNYNIESLDSLVEGANHMAEGIVAVTKDRKMYKRVSERYKLRKGGTEFN
ncbi:hypothetical protein [Cognatishimia sp.]|uniref:hypothetical protein n=1 Tax=Cognatishimia sp. TaxID=2211648 RepID=UPI003513FD8B|nr:hypothetical protein [Cognatishimia sp.]